MPQQLEAAVIFRDQASNLAGVQAEDDAPISGDLVAGQRFIDALTLVAILIRAGDRGGRVQRHGSGLQ
ncbi:MAG TPA: hypothetical protein VNO55_24965, partial [Polyangia bacterium]|nr:hypothetical protein [Polyangia bacterium]